MMPLTSIVFFNIKQDTVIQGNNTRRHPSNSILTHLHFFSKFNKAIFAWLHLMITLQNQVNYIKWNPLELSNLQTLLYK